MKKIIAIAVVLAFTVNTHAQWRKRVKGNGNMVTKTRTVGNYDKIAVGGSFDVKLYEGTEGNIKITVDENLLDYLITEVNGDKLKIQWKKGTNISHRSKVKVTVPFKDIDAVSLAGSGDVYSDNVIKANHFNTKLSGSGDVKLKVEASSVWSSISGSGDIALSGSAKDVEFKIAGSGDVDAYDLASNNAEVRIAGSGGVKINVKDNLVARVAGSGNVYYTGNPKRQDVKVSGSGNVRSR